MTEQWLFSSRDPLVTVGTGLCADTIARPRPLRGGVGPSDEGCDDFDSVTDIPVHKRTATMHGHVAVATELLC